MTRTGLILLLVLLSGPGRAEIAGAERFDTAMAADVYAAAFTFMLPRTLEAVPIAQLTLWGLKGLSTIDPRLVGERRESSLRLLLGSKVLFSRSAPAATDMPGWARLAAEMGAAGFATSAPLRETGTGGIIQSFFDEIFNHLDPYSRYTAPRQAEDDRTRRAGQAGIGVVLALRNNAILVQSVTADGPAAIAGLAVGDTIVAVDGQATRGKSLAAVNGWLTGQEDTPVDVSWRGRDGKTRKIELVRVLVPPESVRAERIGTALVLRISDFNNGTAGRLQQEIELGLAAERTSVGTVQAPIQGIVLDLRGNRGGVLRQAVLAADILLPAGIIASTSGRDPDATRVMRSTGGDQAPFIPVVVLVDGRTASAAEVLAAALADRGRAVVVGSATWGKGLVQTIAELPDGGELRITWSRILAPLGWPIHELGVLPQICTSLGQEVLSAALETLMTGQAPMAEQVARHRALRAPLAPADAVAIRNFCPAAEGREADMRVAKLLIENPASYASALLAPLREAGPAAR